MKNKIIVIPILFLIFIAGLTLGLTLASLVIQYKITNVSAIKTVGVNVYSDPNVTMQIMSLDWRILEPNSSTTKTVYVKSISNVPLTLYVYAENWVPPESTDYMALTANPNNFTMQPNEILEISVILSVAANITGITSFSFDIVFAGAG